MKTTLLLGLFFLIPVIMPAQPSTLVVGRIDLLNQLNEETYYRIPSWRTKIYLGEHLIKCRGGEHFIFEAQGHAPEKLPVVAIEFEHRGKKYVVQFREDIPQYEISFLSEFLQLPTLRVKIRLDEFQGSAEILGFELEKEVFIGYQALSSTRPTRWRKILRRHKPGTP